MFIEDGELQDVFIRNSLYGVCEYELLFSECEHMYSVFIESELCDVQSESEQMHDMQDELFPEW